MSQNPSLRSPEQAIGRWLPLGLVLATATQLRFGGIGPGDLLVGLTMIYGILTIRKIHPVSIYLLKFWAICLGSATLGMLVCMGQGRFLFTFLHDVVAWLLCVLVCFVVPGVLAEVGIGPILRRYVAWTGVGTTLLLFLGWLAPLGIGPIHPWYMIVRFVGWSENPNQLAIWLAPIPFLAFLVFPQSKGFFQKTLVVMAVLGSLIAGFLSSSDALVAGWFLGFVVASFLKLKKFISWRQPDAAAALRLWIVGCAAFFVFAWFSTQITEAFLGKWDGMFHRNGEGQDRLNRWGFAMEAIQSSPIVGFGPGSFSGPYFAFGHEEAHNTWLDWLLSTGLVGFLTLIVYQARLIRDLYLRGPVLISGAFSAYVGIMMFHYVFRHPLVWFFIIIATLVGYKEPEEGRVGFLKQATT